MTQFLIENIEFVNILDAGPIKKVSVFCLERKRIPTQSIIICQSQYVSAIFSIADGLAP
jgi:hypothetical protein